MTDDRSLPAIRPTVSAGGPVGALVPQSIDEAWRLSEAFAKANILPRGITGAPQVMLIICGGAELGLGPFQSLQAFYLVNNRLTIWGDAIPALLFTHGFKIKEWFENVDPAYPDNMVAKCIVTRPDGQEIEGEFSVADAKEAKLWTKDGPWQTAKKRMLKMRARTFAARDGAPDVLRGVAVREEVEDYGLEPGTTTAAPVLTAEFADAPALGEASVPEKPEKKGRAAKAKPSEPEVTPTLGPHDGALPPEEGEKTEPAADAEAETEKLAEQQDVEKLGDIIAGAAPAGIRYLLSSDEPNEQGMTFLYQDGEVFSQVRAETAIKNNPTYDTHPEVAEPINDGPAADDAVDEVVQPAAEGEEQEEPLPPELKAYADKVESAATFVEVKTAMADFYGSAFFKALDLGQQNDVRANTWDAVNEATYADKPDPALDVSAFRLWLEWVDDPEAISATLAVLEGQPAFSSKSDDFKKAIRAAATARRQALLA